jgi:phosphodiesterase/alkaline phosphatase D-like protein
VQFFVHETAGVKNTIWIATDVRFDAYFDPNKAAFRTSTRSGEFISGHSAASTFDRDPDQTFGPQVIYQKGAPTMGGRLPQATDAVLVTLP